MDIRRVAAAAAELLDSLGDRLADRQKSLRRLLWAGEESIAVDMLVSALQHRRIALTTAEFALVREILVAYEGVDLDAKIFPTIHDPGTALAGLTLLEDP